MRRMTTCCASSAWRSRPTTEIYTLSLHDALPIYQLRELDVKVIFSELDFPSTYVETIQRESGVKLYPLSHISYGDYTADKYEKEMTNNLNTVVRAIQEAGA